MNLIDPIHRHAVEIPASVAVITPQGNLTWVQLDRLIWSTALKLHQAGVRESDRIGITMLNPIFHLIASLALTRIGAAQIAVSASEPEDSRASIKAKLALRAFVTDSVSLITNTAKTIFLEKLESMEIGNSAKKQIRSDDFNLPWFILQSSGTTGSPKYAEITMECASERLQRYQRNVNLSQNDIFWAASRLDFLVSKYRTFGCLQSGAAICLAVGMNISNDLVDFLNKTKVTLACGTASQLHQLVAIRKPMPFVRIFQATSSTISEKIRSEFRRFVSENLHVSYGTNECSTVTYANTETQKLVNNTVGLPVKTIDLEIVDSENNRLDSECTGEIRLRGPGIVKGYLENPEATAKSFKDGWFYPGDMGYLSKEGALILQGRKDDMMIFDGINIYPAEIENVLSLHPAVDEVAAFPLKHERFQDIPVAAVKVHQDISEDELMNYSKRLLGIKHPKRIFFIKEFP